MHINVAEMDHKILEDQCRDLRTKLSSLLRQLGRAQERLGAVQQDLVRTMQSNPSLVDKLEDTAIGLETVSTMLAKLDVPDTTEFESYVLESSRLRVREAVNYSPTQEELERLLSEKLARGESINEHLVSGSFSVRRAAKHVLKLDRKRDPAT